MKESEVSDLKKEQGQSQQQIQTQQEELNQLNQKLAKLKNLLGRGNAFYLNQLPPGISNELTFLYPLSDDKNSQSTYQRYEERIIGEESRSKQT